MPTLRSKRTVQNKLVEHAILKMFSKHTIFSLVDVLFKDMKQDYKIYEEAAEEVDEGRGDQPGGGLGQGQEADEQGDEEDKASGGGDLDDQLIDHNEGRDMEQYMEVKSVLYIEKIKDIVGEIMGSCQKQLKYEILEYIMIGVIFERKMLRESFMQELLKAADNAAFRQSLQSYLNANGLTVRGYFQHGGGATQALEATATSAVSAPGGGTEAAALARSGANNRADRILAISWVDMSL